MKRRRIAWALILLLCAAALLSGSLLVLHTGRGCHASACPICMMLARRAGQLPFLLIAFAGAGLFGKLYRGRLYALPENQSVPDWTPVRRKVKLLD
ncbi:MAG: hypothetical protein MR821_04940 [Clostridiales bacterium]|nr:hypothetical protein [Clostridiales bacterium]